MPALVEADPPREERPVGEVEEGGAIQEERPALGQEQREARQVDQPLVDFRLGEVGVDGGDAAQAGREAVGRTSRPTLASPVRAAGGVRPGASARLPDR
ncbi:MAG: hypothetical protein R2708_26840 [Vicinamibacterales bacterium]